MPKTSEQREYMRELVRRYGLDRERVIREYASAEEKGEVGRKSNRYNLTAEQYARALWNDGVRKDWFVN